MATKKPGGWHNPAPYQTTHVRVPTQMKAHIQKQIDEYKERVLTGAVNPDEEYNITTVPLDVCLPPAHQIMVTVNSILKRKKSAKESMRLLLTALYGYDLFECFVDNSDNKA